MISERWPDAGGGDTLCSVPGREHPAAKAGRFVRAAGRAGAAAAREYERQAAARPAPVRAEPPPPPPALRTNDPLGWAVFVGFLVALVALALVALRVETLFGSHTVTLVFRLAAAVVLFLEASLLTSNWQGANQRLGQRLLNRVWGPRGAVTRREKTFARALRDVLTLIGIAFLAGAVFELLAATIGTS
jgi:hypothetical protein